MTASERLALQRKGELSNKVESQEGEMTESDESICEEEAVADCARDVQAVEAEVEDEDTDPILVHSFAEWLESLDGRKKDAKTAKQHRSQINRILSVIDADKNIASLMDFTLLKERFIKYAEERCVAETIKSFLTSIQHFYSFLLSEKPEEIKASSELITQMSEKLKRWSTSYERSNMKRLWERREGARVDIITPDKIEAFENSQAARDVIILFGKLSGAHNIQITQNQYTLVRDFLVQISIDNANRAGVLSNMTLKEFNRAL